MKHLTLFILLLYAGFAFAQKSEVFRIDSLPKQGIVLDKGWKWHAGDNPEWANPEFDDAQWEDIDPTKDIVQLTNISTDQPIWLRIKLNPRDAKNYALSISQSGASEIYLNGRLIQKIGQIDPSNQHTIAYNPLDDHLILKLDSPGNTLAIRYYFQQGLNLDPIYNIRYHLFLARIFDSKYIIASHKSYFWPGFNIGFAFILFFIHGVLFLYYPPLRANFWFSVWAFMSTIFSFFLFQLEINPYLERNAQYVFFSLLTSLLSSFCLLYCQYLLLENKRNIYVYLFVASAFAHIIGYYCLDFAARDIIWLVLTLFQALLLGTMALDANRAGDRRGMPVLFGMLAYIVFWILFSLSFPLSWSQLSKDILFHLATLSLPVTMSALLGFKFRQVNQSMLHNLEQVNQLYVEKQQILATQNETLEKQVTARTAELAHKNRELEIEAALERIRTRAMAMQHSDELSGAANLLFKEVQRLGIPIWSCGYNIMEKDGKSCLGWMSTEGALQPSFRIPLKVSPTFIKFYESRQNGEELFEEEIGGADLETHYNYMLTLDGFGEILKSFINSGHKLPTSQVNTVVNFAQGNLIFISVEPVPKAHDIFKRFANVFEQTFTRFLDLQKAEAQAEQARLNLIQIQTEKKRAEEALIALKQTQNQLIQAEKLASLGELTAGIAHEIQNPLNFVNNFAEVSAEMLDEMHEELEKGDTTEAIAIATNLKTNLEKINHHGQRASSIVKGMLEHSRVSTGVKEPTDLNALAGEFLRLAYHGLRAKDNSFNATLETHFDPDLPLVSVIPQDIGRVLLNLINNAFYAVAERSRSTVQQRASIGMTSSHADTLYQPTVTISTQKTGDQIVIKVKDNGNGIPESIRDKIFQPFFTTKPTGQGTGLGLSLAYDIVTKGHGGKVEVASEDNVGTSFCIYLPFSQP